MALFIKLYRWSALKPWWSWYFFLFFYTLWSVQFTFSLPVLVEFFVKKKKKKRKKKTYKAKFHSKQSQSFLDYSSRPEWHDHCYGQGVEWWRGDQDLQWGWVCCYQDGSKQVCSDQILSFVQQTVKIYHDHITIKDCVKMIEFII